MKITKEYLRKIIKEELNRTLNEGTQQVTFQQLPNFLEKITAEYIVDRIAKHLVTKQPQGIDNSSGHGGMGRAFTVEIGTQGLGSFSIVIPSPEGSITASDKGFNASRQFASAFGLDKYLAEKMAELQG